MKGTTPLRAIVGGTMLTLALTRPRLRWVERLTEDSESHRLWAERALTLFAFAMAGYAWTALYMVLHKQLGHQVDTLLSSSFTSSEVTILAIAIGFAFVTWLLYKAIPHLDSFVDRNY